MVLRQASYAADVPTRTGPRGLTGWHDVCRLNEIHPGRARPLLFNGTEIAVFRDADEVFALGGTCPHRGGPLGSGTVVAGRAVCPLHGLSFDLRTGISPDDPANRVPTYRCRVVDGTVQLDAGSVPAGPGRPDEYLGRWARRGGADRGMAEIQRLAAGGRPGVADGDADSTRSVHGYADLVFRPAQLARPPLRAGDAVDTATVLGARARRPLTLATPLLVSQLAPGALSLEARLALIRGAGEAGTAVGGPAASRHDHAERERAALAESGAKYVLQLAPDSPLFDEDLAPAHGVELRIGSDGFPAQPATGHTLRAQIEELRDRTAGVPIGLRIVAGDVEADLAAAIELGADYVALTGLGAAGGGAPAHARDHVGLPNAPALARARRWLDAHGVTDLQLVASGGLRTPDEMAKALALGADAVALGTASLIAIGCQQYRACERGTCPVGIATQEAELRLRFNPDLSAYRLTTFLRAATTAVADYCRVTGRAAVRDLCAADLAALTPDAAAATGLPYQA